MKNVEQRESFADVFLQDEETANLIRKLVNLAIEKGGNKSNLKESVDIVWKEMYPVEEYVLSDKEMEYSIKVDAFIEHYKEDLINKCEEINIDEEDFLNAEKEILVGLFILWNKGSQITEGTLVNCLKKYSYTTALISRYSIGYNLRLYLRRFFNDLAFDPKNENLYPDCNHWMCYGEGIRIWKAKDFLEFSTKRRYCQYKWSEIAVKSIWFISKYF